ncbi:uncharacterized protein [Paramisgurnus dabryanus]|uniref:uncharacterized protein n=1 Tax=Paramisgurnus dabryanus TaxID=90735 RepID=UPI003CCFA8AE
MERVHSLKMLAVLALVLLVSSVNGRFLTKCELKAQLDAAQIHVPDNMTLKNLIASLVCRANGSAFNTKFVKFMTDNYDGQIPLQGSPPPRLQDSPQSPPPPRLQDSPQSPPPSGPQDTHQVPPPSGPQDTHQGQPPSGPQDTHQVPPPSGPQDTHQGQPPSGPQDTHQVPPPSGPQDTHQVPPPSGPQDTHQGSPSSGPQDTHQGPPPSGPQGQPPSGPQATHQGPPPSGPQATHQGQPPSRPQGPPPSGPKGFPQVPPPPGPKQSSLKPPQEVKSLPQGPKGPRKHKRFAHQERDILHPAVWHQFGLFLLSDTAACDSGVLPSLNICKMNCSALIDDDIMDDISCLNTLMQQVKPVGQVNPPAPINMDYLLGKECEHVDASHYFSDCV